MTVNAILRQGSVFRTAPLTQYDEGQKIHLSGVELPASYLAEFANSETEKTPQITQTTDTIDVPKEYLKSGEPIYVWIVVVGQDERTTRYEIIVPVRGRGEPYDYTPTPSEQTAIEAAIAALNEAVTAAGVAIEHYPRITDGVWQVWDVAAGEWISTEVPAQGPQGETGATGNGIASAVLNADYTLTLTFTNGQTYTTPSIRGAQGDPGPAGQDGQDGYSPTASVSKSGGVATITITDKDGTTTAQVSDGATGQTGPAGADGYSPTASVSKSGSTATITITDKQGTTTAQVSDGAPGPGVPPGGTQGQMLVKKSGTDYDTEWTNQPSVPVQDVQVNGVSVLDAQGVANVPVASSNVLGVAKFDPQYGVNITSAGQTFISGADSSMIKNPIGGYVGYRPIVAGKQHESTFYGLAKAAGDSSQSASDNAVGNYTDAAKVAIQKMLGVYEPPYELIRDITLTERTSVDITVDDNGLPFELLTVFIEVLYAGNLESESSGYGRYIFYDSNSANVVAETGKYVTNTNSAYKNIRVERHNNMVNAYFTRQSTTGGYGGWASKCLGNRGTNFSMGNIVRIALNSEDYEPSGTQIKIYGQRAY